MALVRFVRCNLCLNPMKIHMAHAKEEWINITFVCVECQDTCDIIAQANPPVPDYKLAIHRD